MICNKLIEIENHNTKRNIRKFYKDMEQLNKEYRPYINNCKDRNGNLLKEKDQILERWKHYFQEVFMMNSETEEIAIEEINDDIDIWTEEPTYEKVKKIIQNLKNDKSPGPDKIVNELIKKGDTILCYRLYNLLIRVRRSEQIPDKWKDSYFCPIYKKGGRTNCQNYRAITLLNTAYKILTCIIHNRLAEHAEK